MNENSYILTIRIPICAIDDVAARLRARPIRDDVKKMLKDSGMEEADVK